MTNEFPTQLRDGQVFAYIDESTSDAAEGIATDESTQFVDAYLSEHPEFAPEIQQLHQTHEALLSALDHANAPTTLELGEYLMGMLPADRAAEVEAAIAQHPTLARATADLEAYWAALDAASARAADPQPSLFTQAVAQVDILIARAVDGLRDALAGGPTPALAGLRGDAAEQEQLTFEAGDAHIIIETTADNEYPEKRMVLGLVIGLDASETFAAHLYCGGTMLQKVAVDDLGNFVIPNISPDIHELILSSEQSPTEIHIQHLPI